MWVITMSDPNRSLHRLVKLLRDSCASRLGQASLGLEAFGPMSSFLACSLESRLSQLPRVVRKHQCPYIKLHWYFLVATG